MVSGDDMCRCMKSTIQVMRGSGRLMPDRYFKFQARCLHEQAFVLTRTMIDARRRCLVCDWEQTTVEPADTDVLGPPCDLCHAPTERLGILATHVEAIGRNEHAAALARLGASRGGFARAAALTPRRRREIARAAAQARWSR